MKKYLSSFLITIIFVLSGSLKAQGIQEEAKNNLFVIDDQTTISFSIPKSKFLYSEAFKKSLDISDLQDTKFNQFSTFPGFEIDNFYVMKVQIRNLSSSLVTISAIPGINHSESQFFLAKNGKYKSFSNSPGTNLNNLSKINPSKTYANATKLRNFTFEILQDESVDFYYKFKMPTKSHFI